MLHDFCIIIEKMCNQHKNELCNAFNFESRTGRCELKTDAGEMNDPDPGFTCGTRGNLRQGTLICEEKKSQNLCGLKININFP